jgi:hypothetical protein
VLSDRRRAKERRGLTVWRHAGAVANSAPVTRQCNQDHTRVGKLEEVLGERLEGLVDDGS